MVDLKPRLDLAKVDSEKVGQFLEASVSESTRRAYRVDWAAFSDWCESRGVASMPAAAETVAEYIADMAGSHKPASIKRRLSSIAVAHGSAGFESPTGSQLVRKTLQGIKRTVGTAQTRKTPIRVEQIREACNSFGDSLQDMRDKALLLIGYAGAFRRSELVGIRVEDISFVAEQGVRIEIRRSKTDQEGAGMVKGIGYGMNPITCPVKALRAWIEASGIESGPVFRSIDRHGRMSEAGLSGKGVAVIIKRLADRFGFDPASVAGHSLRAGFVTDQIAKGTPSQAIMNQTGHRDPAMLAGYYREANVFAVNFTAAAGL